MMDQINRKPLGECTGVGELVAIASPTALTLRKDSRAGSRHYSALN